MAKLVSEDFDVDVLHIENNAKGETKIHVTENKRPIRAKTSKNLTKRGHRSKMIGRANQHSNINPKYGLIQASNADSDLRENFLEMDKSNSSENAREWSP